MDRAQKRAIRKEIISILDSKCSSCPVEDKTNVCNSSCEVGERLRKLSSQLLNDENANGHNRSNSHKKGRWTEDEVYYLINHWKIVTFKTLCERLNRSPNQVHPKLQRLIKKGALKKNVN